MLLSLSYYKLACHYFLHLLISIHKSTDPCCNAAQKMKTSSRRAGPSHLPVVWCFVLLLRPLGLVISSVIILDVTNTGYTIYFTICCFMCKT
jgi:hypothetical protein